jgi:hypothetical protein
MGEYGGALPSDQLSTRKVNTTAIRAWFGQGDVLSGGKVTEGSGPVTGCEDRLDLADIMTLRIQATSKAADYA